MKSRPPVTNRRPVQQSSRLCPAPNYLEQIFYGRQRALKRRFAVDEQDRQFQLSLLDDLIELLGRELVPVIKVADFGMLYLLAELCVEFQDLLELTWTATGGA